MLLVEELDERWEWQGKGKGRLDEEMEVERWRRSKLTRNPLLLSRRKQQEQKIQKD